MNIVGAVGSVTLTTPENSRVIIMSAGEELINVTVLNQDGSLVMHCNQYKLINPHKKKPNRLSRLIRRIVK